MIPSPLTARLRDGSSIEIRPVTPEDRGTLRRGLERLSPESRYRRFFGPMPKLSDRDLDYLTRVDHHDHEALVACDPATGEGVGVARYVRTKPAVAEPAIVVIDDWQGRGVGGELLQALVDRAREEGIERFQAPVLATNNEAIRLLESLGQTTRDRAGRELELTIELPQPDVPARWPGLLRQLALGTLQPARTVLDWLWPRRPGAPDDARANVIVVGTDGTSHATVAISTAAALASASGARIEIVSAQPFMVGDRERSTGVVGELAARLRARGLQTGEHVRRGDPAVALTDVAAQCNARLIVVGAGEREGTSRRILGSVADMVAERSPCDVLIVRPRSSAAPTAGAHG